MKKMIFDKKNEEINIKTAYLLWLFLGIFGAHRIYLRRMDIFKFIVGFWCLGLALLLLNFEIGKILLYLIGALFIFDGFYMKSMVDFKNKEILIEKGLYKDHFIRTPVTPSEDIDIKK